MLKLVLLAVFVTMFSAACASPCLPITQWGSELPPELDRVLRDYERAWIAHDADALAALFTERGYVLSNGRPPVQGREAIRAAYASAGGPLWLQPLTAAAQKNTGYIVGVYGHEPGKPPTGKFVLALQHFTTGWLIAADIDNSIEQNQGNGTRARDTLRR